MAYAYYRMFPGDYQRDTMHLGWLEDLAYRRLIEVYMSTGKPIRNDRGYIMRVVRAFEPEQQAAVDNVLSEFFIHRPDGWHQARCDAEIKFRDRKSKLSKKAAAERWKEYKELHANAERPQSGRYANQNQNYNIKNLSNHTESAKNDRPVAGHRPNEFSNENLKTKAARLKIEARPGESWEQYQARVRHARNPEK
jgi:uncharacterized protein YdaU (DUF1376 family)